MSTVPAKPKHDVKLVAAMVELNVLVNDIQREQQVFRSEFRDSHSELKAMIQALRNEMVRPEMSE